MGPASGLRLLRNLLSASFRVMADVPCQQACPFSRWRSILSKCCPPITFRLSPFRWHCWCRASHYPPPCISAHIDVTAYYPSGLLMHHFVWILGCPLLSGEHGWWQSSMFSGSLNWIPLALSLASPIGTVPSALINSYFFISILSWRYTYLFSAKLRSGCLFSFGPAWTASGLGQWFFHESSFFFTDMSLLAAINKTCIHR